MDEKLLPKLVLVMWAYMDHAMFNMKNNQIHGALPYITPEVLHGENYSAASDIYSFGIVIVVLLQPGKDL